MSCLINEPVIYNAVMEELLDKRASNLSMQSWCSCLVNKMGACHFRAALCDALCVIAKSQTLIGQKDASVVCDVRHTLWQQTHNYLVGKKTQMWCAMCDTLCDSKLITTWWAKRRKCGVRHTLWQQTHNYLVGKKTQMWCAAHSVTANS